MAYSKVDRPKISKGGSAGFGRARFGIARFNQRAYLKKDRPATTFGKKDKP